LESSMIGSGCAAAILLLSARALLRAKDSFHTSAV
jgi:hypothetical protein